MIDQIIEKKYMGRCLELARQGFGNTSPNPMVGAVIVNNNKIIGEGYHVKYGESHAEVNAINSVKDQSLLNKSTLYVNLEPCSHIGKTPPCTNLIIEKKIPRVVIGTIDPNSLVAGKGIKKLKDAGIKVIPDVLKKECIDLNIRFFTYYNKQRPYIILKWAQTSDGFIDIDRKSDSSSGLNWISNDVSRILVHKWRSEEDAILVGTNTALIDNPRLNTREWEGTSPVRIVLDRILKLPDTLNVFDKSSRTILFNEKKNLNNENLEFVKISFDKEILKNICSVLYKKNIQSLIVEGGKKTLESFMAENLWDEARIFHGNKIFKQGVKAPKFSLLPNEIIEIKDDTLHIIKNFNSNNQFI